MQRNLLILCGGRSAEHEVSLVSARNILTALDKEQYTPHVVLISRDGQWLYLPHWQDIETLKAVPSTLPKAAICSLMRVGQQVYIINETGVKQVIDLAFPVLHGPMGEDGTIQGMFEVLGLPYVGSGVLSSAVAMDKLYSKMAFAAAGLPIAPYFALSADEVKPTFNDAQKRLTTEIVFVKPAVMGSSVGVSKVRTQEQWDKALRLAFSYGSKVIVEAMVVGREVECAVLGGEQPKASILGEIRPTHDFYSYESKYLDPNGAELIVPAPLSEKHTTMVQQLAIKAFQALSCAGMARIDFFFCEDGRAIVNEANTIPGFTSISMYPMLWQNSGMTYSGLISKLLELALSEFAAKQVVSTDHLLAV
ncbi:MAG: D-alanine--D-alanine ligase [Proteobacteria bacterium]|nr:D-alanine--D-alanine ligase [Pseudomonadota bacterium]